jgi:hypothetical protein
VSTCPELKDRQIIERGINRLSLSGVNSQNGSTHYERAPRSWQDVAAPATGWGEPVCGRELHPLEGSGFHGALFQQLGVKG